MAKSSSSDSPPAPPHPPPVPSFSTVIAFPAASAFSFTAPCPYSCFDEFTIGAFKGFFAGSLWGAYALHQNWRQSRLAAALLPFGSAAPSSPPSSQRRARQLYQSRPIAKLLPVGSTLATASSSPSSFPLAALLSPRLRLFSPVAVYPVKFAALLACYRMLTCTSCHLTSPSHPSILLSQPLCGALSGFVVSIPHLDVRRSARMMAGCGALAFVLGLVQLGVQEWRSINTMEWGSQAEWTERTSRARD